MRLAFLAPEFLPTWGGVGIYSAELVKNLSRYKDMEIHVITPTRGQEYDAQKVIDYFGRKIHLHNISAANDGFFYNWTFQLAVLRNLRKLHQKHDFELVHSASLVHMPDIYLKFGRQAIPTLTTVHTTLKSQTAINGKHKLGAGNGKSTVETLTSAAYPYIGLMEKLYLARTHNYIAVSNWIKSMLPEQIQEKNIEVIHNGIDTQRFSPKSSPKGTDFDYLEEQGKPIVLYCGRLLALKGLKTLIDSMKAVLSREDAYFVFAGTGDVPFWQGMLEKKGILKDSYAFLGYVGHEKIHQLYQKADIFVLPSYTDSCPITVLEAMASQLPIIASDVGGVSELVRNRKECLLVKPGHPQELAGGLIELLSDSRLRKQLASAARARAEKEFDSRVMASRTKRFYDQVVG